MAFTSPGLDIYLFILAETTAKRLVRMVISGPEPSMGLTHASLMDERNLHEHTTHRNIMSVVDIGQNFTIKYKGEPRCCNGNWWAGFSVSGYMDPLVAFSVARSTSMTSLGLIRYDTEIVYTGQFNMGISTFVTPLNGIYYFSISAGLFPANTAELMLRVNGKDMYVLFHNSSAHDGIRTISGSTLLDLQIGDLVTLHLTKGQIYSSPEQHEVSFMCFLYSPKHGNSATWMVSKTDNNSYIRPISYNKVHFVKGVQYHITNTIIASVSGIYYIYNSVMVAPISGSVAMKTYLYINYKCICNYQVYYSSVEMNGLVTFSASFLYKLNAGDKLTIGTNTKKYIMKFNDQLRSTSFMGFLITETDE